ncbi:calcium-binding protein [Phenylobacterium sp.]|uniref:calcium-binding protein n=1 Tax=Phenylobacterium sp. TaxID=1871053 RepID=UPI002F956F19
MARYAFETITANQAAAITAADTVTFAGRANATSVVYQSYDPLALTPEVPSILVTLDGRTVKFGTAFTQVTKNGQAEFADGSKLVVGDTSDERIAGSVYGDGLYGGPGHDSVNGGRGDDLIQGNAGDDRLEGDLGSNTLYGGQGDDVIYVATAAETRGGFAHGNAGNDEIFGGGGGDTLLGGRGDDLLVGLDGADYLSGDLGDDELHGGAGADTLLGGEGNDIIQTGGGADRVLAGAGDDRIAIFYGGSAIVDGEDGNDTITSVSVGKDVLSGGAGRDVFEFVSHTRPAAGQDDTILDWSGADDKLRFQQVSIYALGGGDEDEAAHSILPLEYSEFVATSYDEALRIANEHISGPGAKYVAAQVGQNVYVFVDSDGDPTNGADAGVVLVGRTLADISLTNFI